MIVRRSFSEACNDGDLFVVVRDAFAIRRDGSIVEIPFARLSAAEVAELAAALRVAADRIDEHGAELSARPSNVVALNVWR